MGNGEWKCGVTMGKENENGNSGRVDRRRARRMGMGNGNWRMGVGMRKKVGMRIGMRMGNSNWE